MNVKVYSTRDRGFVLVDAPAWMRRFTKAGPFIGAAGYNMLKKIGDSIAQPAVRRQTRKDKHS